MVKDLDKFDMILQAYEYEQGRSIAGMLAVYDMVMVVNTRYVIHYR